MKNPKAFPSELHYVDTTTFSGGMTLLDYFAGRAMQGITVKRDYTAESVSEDSYKIAKAMLKEREKYIK